MAKILQFRGKNAAAPGDEAHTLSALKAAVEAGNAARAEELAQTILGVNAEHARRCVLHFSRALRDRPDLPHRMARLRMALDSGLTNDAIVLFGEVFGLTIGEAVLVYGNMRRTFA